MIIIDNSALANSTTEGIFIIKKVFKCGKCIISKISGIHWNKGVVRFEANKIIKKIL